VRGVSLGKDDRVISMTILRHFDATPDERVTYLKMSRAVRGMSDGESEEAGAGIVEEEEAASASTLAQERYAEMSAAEEFVLTISENGFGKRTSSYEYRTSGRGGKGIIAMVVNDRNGAVAASFPIETDDQIMLVTDGGQLIRCPIDGVRIAARSTQGVRVFDIGDSERVVSVERLSDLIGGPDDDDDDDGEGGEGGDGGAPDGPEPEGSSQSQGEAGPNGEAGPDDEAGL
jgi:DNA gyrase subunit A